MLNVKYIISENICIIKLIIKITNEPTILKKARIDNKKIDVYLHEIESKPRYFFIKDINLYNSEKEDIDIYNLISSSSFYPEENF